MRIKLKSEKDFEKKGKVFSTHQAWLLASS